MNWFLPALFLVAPLSAGPAEEGKPSRGVRLPAEPSAEVPIEGFAEGLLLHDIDGDGFLDLFVAAHRGGDDGPSYLFLSKEGKFQEPSWISEDESVSAGAALGDLEGDGDLDLVLVRYNTNPAAAFRNLGKGVFEKEAFWRSADTIWASQAFVDDFDGDGLPDILARGYGDEHRIYRGGKEGPSPEAGWAAEEGWASSKAILADVDGDRRRDLVTTSRIGAAYTVFRGLRKDFEERPSMAAKELGEHGGLAVGDLDGDGFPEIAAGSRHARRGDGRVRLYGNRKGAITSEPIWLSDDVDAEVSELVFADLDRDGDLDLFVLSGDHTAAYENRNGALAPHPFWRASLEGGEARIADLDRNGYPDLITGDREKVRFFYGGAGIDPVKAEPFPEMPALPAQAEEVETTEVLGLRLARWSPALEERYGLEGSKGVVVLGVPEHVHWRLQIGNLREGDVILGAGSFRNHGHHVEAAGDPAELMKLVLEYGKEGKARQIGLQWRCGPLHPACRGQVRREELRLSTKDWNQLLDWAGEPVEREPADVPLEGTVTVVDEKGQEHREEDGGFSLVLWKDHEGTDNPVKVLKGKWKTTVPSDVRLGVEHVRLRGRPAHVESEETLAIPEDGRLEIQAEWLRATVLRVVGEDTRADLRGIEVVSVIHHFELEDCLHPGSYSAKNVVQRDARSPIDLELDETRFGLKRTYWVRAPGYAWSRLQVDHRAAGERVLVLKRAADLEVTLQNYREDSEAVLRLRERKRREEGDEGEKREDRRPIVEMKPVEDGPTLIAGIAPGTFDLTVEMGEWWKSPHGLGKAQVDLVAGRKEIAVLRLEDLPVRPDPVPLEGTLHLPQSIRRAFRLNLKALDLPSIDFEDWIRIERSDMTRVEGKPGLYRWSAGKVIPGRYQASIRELFLEQVIVVGPAGERNACLEVAELAEMSVRVIDGDTGQDAEVNDILWEKKSPDPVGEMVARDQATGIFTFRAPAGEISLELMDPRFRSCPDESGSELTVRKGKNEHILRVERACGVRLTLVEGEARVPWDWNTHRVQVKRLDGPEKEESQAGESDWVQVSHPGLYEVRLKRIEGYEPVAPIQVEVKPREYADVEVKLVRKQ